MANNNGNDNGNPHMTEYCVMCRRSDTAAGKMIHMPGNLCVCNDCMQKMMDFAGNMDFSKMTSDPSMTRNLFRMFYGGPSYSDTQDSGKKSGSAGNASAGKDSASEKKGTAGSTAEVISQDPDVIVENTAEDPETEDEIGGGPVSHDPVSDDKSSEDPASEISGAILRALGAGSYDDDEEEENDQEGSSGKNRKGPSISFLNLGDIFGNGGGFGQAGPKVKKKKKNARKPVFSIDNIPAPHKIKEELDRYVIGQDRAKKFISVAAYNHYKRVKTGTMDEIEIEKSNILLIGPTGCGKTYLVRTLAELLDVPLAISDATSLTEAGYIGDDIESVISKLLAAADNDVEKAEKGIVFIDEIDKIAKKRNTNSRDVSGESVQQGLLKLLEGAEIEVPVGASSKNAMVPLVTVNTRNILFICGGAFPNLETIIRERLQKQTSMGFSAQLKDHFDNDKNILDHVTNEDLRRFGMIPEFIGRLPITCVLQGLDTDMLVRILREPKNAILKQYQKLLALDEVDLEFEDDALEAIAAKALERDTGARALRSVIEEFMMDIMYEIPKDDNIGKVTITRAFVEGKGGPVIEIRTETPRQIAMSQAVPAADPVS
jgi:ATP-dependent Clp protease ATP-binding subunit ClpX